MARGNVGGGRRDRNRHSRRPPAHRSKEGKHRSRNRSAASTPERDRRQSRLDSLLHIGVEDDPVWKFLPLVLVLAFVARSAIALSGDFVLHPDEIFQYLEPAHRLAFGHGLTYWEFFYGGRSWLVPGAVAGLLKLCDAVGLGQPFWYIGAVKLAFCASSVAIPASMYFFARRHFSEASARVALVAGAFWYELAGFAHKPMTEFVATVPLMALLAITVRPAIDGSRTIWQAAFLAVIAVAVRLQYAPIALLLLAVVLARTNRKALLTVCSSAFFLAVGAFDAITWDSSLFHSYLTNIRFNLVLSEMLSAQGTPYQFLLWLAIAGGGLSVLSIVLALPNIRRYGLLLGLIAMTVLVHSLQAHKEYRFVFAIIPLWLLVGSDIVTQLANGAGRRWVMQMAAAIFAVVSACGTANVLPRQDAVYQAWSNETGAVSFVRDHDPIFDVYRYLALEPSVKSVWQVDREYHQSPGYYYLHRGIPFYDLREGGNILGRDLEKIHSSVSHIVSGDPTTFVPGYSLDREFSGVRILRRDANDGDVQKWQGYTPVLVDSISRQIVEQINPGVPAPPEDKGFRFAD